MRNTRHSGKRLLGSSLFFGIIFLVCSGVWGAGPISNMSVAHANALDHQSGAASCPVSATPTSQSLLIVLLDRSGSLTEGSNPTDPNGYSTSVTKALTELWPGNMAVIPFSGDTLPLPVFGPDTLSDPTQKLDLQNKVQNYPIGGNTPLGPAMHQALDLLRQKGYPTGSRVIVITDGNPTGQGNNDGPHQEDDIRHNLIGQFCNAGIPVSAFGLTIDSTTSDGQDANRLLTDITRGTNTTYTNVTGPKDLAREVIKLYAQWLNLSFTLVQEHGNDFPVAIDTFAQQVSIVTFRSDSIYNIQLIAPNGSLVTQGVQKSTDRHYEIDSFNVSGPILAGNYTVNTGGDPNAQVYALISSPLQVQLVAPTAKTVAYDNTRVHIEAQFLNGQNVLTPAPGQGQIIATVTLLVNGQTAGPPANDIVLQQQGNTAIFSGDSLIYKQPGQVKIDIKGTYQQVTRQTSFTLQLLIPPLPRKPEVKCNTACVLRQYIPWFITGGTVLLLLLTLLIAWLIWDRRNPAPCGILRTPPPTRRLSIGREDEDNADIPVYLSKVGASRPLMKRISHRSVLTSYEIESHRDSRGGFDFDSASFELIFKGNCIVDARVISGGPVILKNGNDTTKIDDGESHILESGSSIIINGKECATFSS